MSFPLNQWFDINQKISKDDVNITEAQMALYAIKDGLDPEDKDCLKQYKEMRQAVNKHNKKFLK